MSENKFCNKDDIGNEADVESFLLLRLFAHLGYKDKNIKNKKALKEIAIPKGSKKENYKPDFVLTIGGGA